MDNNEVLEFKELKLRIFDNKHQTYMLYDCELNNRELVCSSYDIVGGEFIIVFWVIAFSFICFFLGFIVGRTVD